MNNKEKAKEILSLFPNITATPRYNNQIEILSDIVSFPGLIRTLKEIGFKHLSNLTCVDWIEEKRFDITYNLWSYTDKIHITMKVGINRDKPRIPSIHDVWPAAQVYERETHEMFGVEFDGNPNLSHLFLHNWQDIPPLRKDFDTEKYAIEAYDVDRYNSKKGGKK